MRRTRSQIAARSKDAITKQAANGICKTSTRSLRTRNSNLPERAKFEKPSRKVVEDETSTDEEYVVATKSNHNKSNLRTLRLRNHAADTLNLKPEKKANNQSPSKIEDAKRTEKSATRESQKSRFSTRKIAVELNKSQNYAKEKEGYPCRNTRSTKRHNSKQKIEIESSDDTEMSEELSEEEETSDCTEIEEIPVPAKKMKIAEKSHEREDSSEKTLHLFKKIQELEASLLKIQSQYEKELKKKEEEFHRLKNELEWKEEQLEELTDISGKNMELEAQISFMLTSQENYEEIVKKKEDEAKQKEEEKAKKEAREKLKVKKSDADFEENGKKRNKRRLRKRKGNEEESEEEDIDALFISDAEDSDIQVVEEKKPKDDVNLSKIMFEVDAHNSGVPVNSLEEKLQVKNDVKEITEIDISKDEEKQGRHNIRKLMGAKKLQEETIKAAKTEKERRDRAKKEHDKHLVVFDTNLKNNVKVCKQLVLSFKEGTKEPLVEVNSKLLKKIKPHQVEGVQFMWDNVIESVDRLNDGDKGQGCILAHCMGLGKTLSVITLIHTLLKTKALNFKTCMVICPLNTVLNWQYEWKKWLGQEKIQIYELASCKNNHDRAELLSNWHEKGGVVVIGYQLFRILANYSGRSKKNRKAFEEALIDPGPDIVVCDEGHMLKNDASAISKAVNRIKSRRRIILTGTPLQNNLAEYHCMMSFVKPSLLGTMREFKNRFVNPISNGQHSDSTATDVKIMKRRVHVLHQMLEGCVQRKDYSELSKLLPPKHEYVISIRLTELQIKLYETYLEQRNSTSGSQVASYGAGAGLFADYQALMRIWTHPYCLKLQEERDELRLMMERDDELDTGSEEEEMSISSDTEDEGTTDVVSSSGEETDCEDSSDSKTTKAEPKSRNKHTKNNACDKASHVSRNTRSVKCTSTRNSNEQTNQNKNSVKDEKKREEMSKKPEVKKKSLDGIEDEDSDIMEVSEPNIKDRKAKVLAGEVIRKWGSTSRHGGTEALTWEDLKKKDDAWWTKLVTDDHFKQLEISGKLVFMFEVLRLAESLGDKVLVFSHSLLALDLIEMFLKFKTEEAQEALKNKKTAKPEIWVKDEDYLRMDGSTVAQSRSRLMADFNDVKNKRTRLFLISTKAGGLGINLEIANRVIIFDASWNPSHDIQSIFRVYRFGQTKPVYVYRLLAQGTMEEKIYERQVIKETLAQRVVDEHQIDRHFTAADLAELYNFKPDRLNEQNSPKKRPTPVVPKDLVLAELLISLKDAIVKYHEHDSLLENRPDEDLTEEEREAAWEDYEKEKQGIYTFNNGAGQAYRTPFDGDKKLFKPPIIIMPNNQIFGNGRTNTEESSASNPVTVNNLLGSGMKPGQSTGNSFQMAQLPRVVQEIMKYNPSIGAEELQKRLQAFLGMQSRYSGAGNARIISSQNTISNKESDDDPPMPSRLPLPGKVPATATK